MLYSAKRATRAPHLNIQFIHKKNLSMEIVKRVYVSRYDESINGNSGIYISSLLFIIFECTMKFHFSFSKDLFSIVDDALIMLHCMIKPIKKHMVYACQWLHAIKILNWQRCTFFRRPRWLSCHPLKRRIPMKIVDR